ncbi:hypothetical protein [Companilactobacillus mishanensis]|uniref:hypothetical protein n=1 Tax=Companilactobacillus mishanensis TaxID=2486008 RepID=UPI001294C383|nr:hypothetical protein [Companilactobacillus mishanensis]MQS89625.1 hypothetical protein [Companilactobacillus mishanensis]
MKKNIKYAGVVAATLLAVAPIATSATTVQAADTTSATQDKISDWFQEQLDSIKAKAEKVLPGITKWLDSLANQKTDTNGETKATVDAASIVDGLKNQTYNKPSELKDFSILERHNNKTPGEDTTVLATILNSLGMLKDGQKDVLDHATDLSFTLSGAEDDNDFNAQILNMTKNGNGASFRINITLTNTKTKKAVATQNITFTNNSTVVAKATNIGINYTSPIAIGLNTDVLNERLTNSVTATVTDDSGKNLGYKQAIVGQDFYSSRQDANANDSSKAVDPGATFTKDGAQYYQRVTLVFDPESINVAKVTSAMGAGADQGIKINGENAQKYQINQDNDNSITYVRELAVGTQPNDNDNNTDTDTDTTPDETWSMTPNSGIVTVNSSLAPLHNDDNDVTTRSLGANSAWQTDQYRVNSKTGEKQYRVSSHEWVSSDYVTFGGTTSNGSGLSNVSDLTGHHTISLAGPDSFVYALFGINGGRSNRGLAGNSAWFTDKSATDSEGNTFYRVSTDEWVQAGSGVTFN